MDPGGSGSFHWTVVASWGRLLVTVMLYVRLFPAITDAGPDWLIERSAWAKTTTELPASSAAQTTTRIMS